MNELTNEGFYLAACAAFIAIFGAGVIAEISGDEEKQAERHVLPIVVVLGLVAMTGEVVALYVLVSGEAAGWSQAIVSWALLGLLAIAFGAAVGAVRRRSGGPRAARTAGRFQLFATFGALLVAGVAVGLLFALDVKGFGTPFVEEPRSRGLGPRQFYVIGTCAAGPCKLYERRAPNRDQPHIGVLRDRDVVTVVCQIAGELIVHPVTGASSFVWNKLENGRYVTDLFVQTPGDPWTSGLPRCP